MNDSALLVLSSLMKELMCSISFLLRVFGPALHPVQSGRAGSGGCLCGLVVLDLPAASYGLANIAVACSRRGGWQENPAKPHQGLSGYREMPCM